MEKIRMIAWPPPGSRDGNQNGPPLDERQLAIRQERLNQFAVNLYGKRVAFVSGEPDAGICWMTAEVTKQEKADVEEYVAAFKANGNKPPDAATPDEESSE